MLGPGKGRPGDGGGAGGESGGVGDGGGGGGSALRWCLRGESGDEWVHRWARITRRLMRLLRLEWMASFAGQIQNYWKPAKPVLRRIRDVAC